MRSLHFRTKALLFIIPLLIVVSSVYTYESINAQKDIARKELIKRSEIGTTLASRSSELAILSRNDVLLKQSASLLRGLPDVAFIAFYDRDMTLLHHENIAGELPDFLELPPSKTNYIDRPGYMDFVGPVVSERERSEVSMFTDTSAARTKETIGFVRIGFSKHTLRSAELLMVKRGLLLALLFMSLSAIAVYLFITRATQPLRTLCSAARQIEEGHYPILGLRSSDEIGELANCFDSMSGAIKEREVRLIESNRRIEDLFDRVEHAIFRINAGGRIVTSNKKFRELCGSRDTLEDLLPDGNWKLVLRKAAAGRMKGAEQKIMSADDREMVVLLSVYPDANQEERSREYDAYFLDITEKKRLQEQLFQSQKMESIGVLAGGIAHDFNNILSAILGHAELLREFGKLDDKGKERAGIIENAARKAGQMISKLLSFARQESVEHMPIDLNDIAKDTIDLLERIMTKKNIAIKRSLDRALPSIEGDAGQIEQVLMNIIVNAGDVMPDGGVITVETSVVDLSADTGDFHPLLAPGKYALLRISDTGLGIPEEIRDKIFDPFFTTKAAGKGTGLGLSMVYGIVKEHRGAIDVKSKLGRGTTFEIYLPASSKLIPRLERPFISSVAGREKILVVDDEEDIISFIKDVLESQGYKVLATTNPVYALDIFKEISDTIDLVISDIVMPLVNGRELIRHFKLIKPAVRVLAISGYEAGTIDKSDRDINGFLRKPFEGMYLLSAVRKVLGSADTPSSSQRLLP